MIRSLFVSMQELNKGARRPADVPPTKLKKVGVVGAGFMGAGIALGDGAGRHRGGADRPRPGEPPTRARPYSHKLIGDQVKQGPRASAPSATRCSRASRRPPDYGALKDCDLVIEAVFEDRKVKAESIAKAQAVIGDKVVFGSNTSTLPITSLADRVRRTRRASSASISSRRSTR